MSSSKNNFDEINLNETKQQHEKIKSTLEPINEQEQQENNVDETKQNLPQKSPSISSGSISPVTPSSTPPMPSALNNPETPVFYSLVSGIEIDEETSGDDTFVEARNELIQTQENNIEIQQQPPKPPRNVDIVNSTITQGTNTEEKLQQNIINKPNELPMLGFVPTTEQQTVPPSEKQQPKQHSPPPNYTSVYPPPPSNPVGGQLPSSGFEARTQGGIGLQQKASATYYIDGNFGGPAIIISQGGEPKVATPVFLFAPDPYGEEYLRRRRAISFLSCMLILLPLFTLLLIILSWGSYYY